jgi:hypothetical protein
MTRFSGWGGGGVQIFSFSLQHLSKTFLFLRRTERDVIINVYRSSCEAPVIQTHIRLHENSSNESRAVPCGQMDRHDEANGRVLKFYKSA